MRTCGFRVAHGPSARSQGVRLRQAWFSSGLPLGAQLTMRSVQVMVKWNTVIVFATPLWYVLLTVDLREASGRSICPPSGSCRAAWASSAILQVFGPISGSVMLLPLYLICTTALDTLGGSQQVEAPSSAF